jgi:NDP-sugar pyrophosphorylase family protein
MLLAAGLGDRMQPISRARAKPALPILDEPLIARLIRQLSAQGVTSVVVNVHAHPETLERVVRDAPIPVSFSREPELLGSGGGIRAARELLDREGRFLVLNGDMGLDLDLAAFLEAHERSGSLATLGLRDDPRKRRFGSIGYDAEGSVCRITNLVSVRAEKGSALFIGAQMLEPAIFENMPERAVFSVFEDLYAPMLRRGERVATWLQPPSAAWWPVGSPAELLEANLEALERLVRIEPGVVREGESARIEGAVIGPVWIGEDAHVEAGARVGPWAVLGAGAEVPGGWEVEESLWLPAARPGAREPRSLRRAVAFDAEVWVDG